MSYVGNNLHHRLHPNSPTRVVSGWAGGWVGAWVCVCGGGDGDLLYRSSCVGGVCGVKCAFEWKQADATAVLHRHLSQVQPCLICANLGQSTKRSEVPRRAPATCDQPSSLQRSWNSLRLRDTHGCEHALEHWTALCASSVHRCTCSVRHHLFVHYSLLTSVCSATCKRTLLPYL